MAGTAIPSGYASVALGNPESLERVGVVVIDTDTVSGNAYVAVHERAHVVCPFVDVYEGVSESKQPQWSTLLPVGRSEGIKVFSGSSNRVVSVLFRFRWLSGERREDVVEQVVTPARFLQGLTAGFVTLANRHMPPPPVNLSLPGVEWMRCIVESCEVRWVAPWWTDGGTPVATGSDVQVTFAEVRDMSYDATRRN
jgi:hypothetical protein